MRTAQIPKTSQGARSSAVELRTFNPGVVGSNPTGPSTNSYLESQSAGTPW